MNCIKCDKEAEYIYVYALPISGVCFITTGGSFCREHLEEARKQQMESHQAWVEFYKVPFYKKMPPKAKSKRREK